MERLTERDEFGNAYIIALSDMMPEIYAEFSFSETNALTDALNRLAAYEDTGLEPEEITIEPYGCVFYCNRECNLDGDSCPEGPGCPYEIDAETAKHLLELAQAEKDGRIAVLPLKIGDHLFRLFAGEVQHLLVNNVIYREVGGDACKILVECIPFHRFYWREDFGKTVFLTREEAEAALKKMEADNEAD